MDRGDADSIWFVIEPPNPPNQGIMFANHAKPGRSGHLGHALVEYAPGKVLAFYANCSDFHKGHSGDGWMEYRRSEDSGRTWGEPSALEYSRETYEKGVGHSVMCEKAVRTDDGAIILFNLECKGKAWKPLAVPTCLCSADGGLTWEAAKSMGDQPGRIWDAMLSDSCIWGGAEPFCSIHLARWGELGRRSLPSHGRSRLGRLLQQPACQRRGRRRAGC